MMMPGVVLVPVLSSVRLVSGLSLGFVSPSPEAGTIMAHQALESHDSVIGHKLKNDKEKIE